MRVKLIAERSIGVLTGRGSETIILEQGVPTEIDFVNAAFFNEAFRTGLFLMVGDVKIDKELESLAKSKTTLSSNIKINESMTINEDDSKEKEECKDFIYKSSKVKIKKSKKND